MNYQNISIFYTLSKMKEYCGKHATCEKCDFVILEEYCGLYELTRELCCTPRHWNLPNIKNILNGAGVINNDNN